MKSSLGLVQPRVLRLRGPARRQNAVFGLGGGGQNRAGRTSAERLQNVTRRQI